MKNFLSNNKCLTKGRGRHISGFSLLEMIVAIGIFLTALVIILGALVSINNAARKARSERIVGDNLSAAIDSMSRSMRTGSSFHCGDDTVQPLTVPLDCPMTDDLGSGGDSVLAFEGQEGDPANENDQIVYLLSDGHIERSTDGGENYLPLTAPELNITTLKFYVHGSTTGQDQPVITMLIRGSAATTPRTETKFDIQTTITALTPNI